MPDMSPIQLSADSLSSLRAFLEQFCHNSHVDYYWIENDIAVLQLSDELASLMDGPRTPGYICKLALSPASAQAHTDAELFIPGSYRWDRFLEITLDQARVSCQYVVGIPGFLDGNSAEAPEEESGHLVYEPHILSHWRLSYRTEHVTRRQVLDLAVNLVTGHLQSGYYQNLLRCNLADKALPLLPRAKRQLSFKAAYRVMSDEIEHILAQEDSTWAKTAQSQLADEIQALEKYYRDRLAANAANESLLFEKEKRIQELKQRSHPRVLASPFATTLVYIPMICYQASIGKQTLCLRFDPISGQALY
ncbi:MAG: hypothetical protein GX998_07590 [Firmicutes bacterium]|nr:hypothetical protein [Bacillota bacterium]